MLECVHQLEQNKGKAQVHICTGSSGLGLRPAYQTVRATHVSVPLVDPQALTDALDGLSTLLQPSPLASHHVVTEAHMHWLTTAYRCQNIFLQNLLVQLTRCPELQR